MEWNDETPDPSELREPAFAYGKNKFTIEEYLEMERAAIEKSEYYQGEIFTMSGASGRHILICRNLFLGLSNRSKGKSCYPVSSDMRVHIPENTLFTYPDISIFCGGINCLDKEDDNALNPAALIEILSPSTRRYDRGQKFQLYQQIPTLKEYILVDTQAIQVLVFRPNAQNRWELVADLKELSSLLEVQTLGVSMPLSEVYEYTRLL